MKSKNLLSKLIAQVCSEDYSRANSTLDSIITEKIKNKIKKLKNKDKKETVKDK